MPVMPAATVPRSYGRLRPTTAMVAATISAASVGVSRTARSARLRITSGLSNASTGTDGSPPKA